MFKIHSSEKVFVLTGAGISAESGIRTFRDTGGLWENFKVEDVATPEGFERNPEMVWKFYNQRRSDLKKVEPNPGHYALAEMQKRIDDFFLVTQNVDNLHERAESVNLVHMHGELLKVRCLDCGKVFHDDSNLGTAPRCALCNGLLRPHIVWFGEVPFEMDRIMEKLGKCDWFIGIGTSGIVYPAAQFISAAKRSGAKTIFINPDPGSRTRYADYFMEEKAGIAVPQLLERTVSR